MCLFEHQRLLYRKTTQTRICGAFSVHPPYEEHAMKLPLAISNVVTAIPHICIDREGGLSASVVPAAKICITGKALCKKGGSTLYTAEETVCGDSSNFHAWCTEAKNRAAGSLSAVCGGAGGTVSHSGASCTAGDKCKNDGECQ